MTITGRNRYIILRILNKNFACIHSQQFLVNIVAKETKYVWKYLYFNAGFAEPKPRLVQGSLQKAQANMNCMTIEPTKKECNIKLRCVETTRRRSAFDSIQAAEYHVLKTCF
jgi:hypothetical protein